MSIFMAKILNLQVPIYARALDLKHLLDLKKAGATDAILESAETSLQLGSKLLKGLGVMSDDVNFLRQLFRDSMELQAQEGVSKTDDREFNSLKPMQVLARKFEDVNFLQLQLELLCESCRLD
ncbi:unnamed protein product [Prunus armeniaca]|uniref:Uncharacterized protein n=1 Tax=Prunus armeniaca TaxID=36596 RepID=A0A6J5VRE9_PRUAR|nr:unnamed protein product [Prunus armeniaca]